MNKCKTLWRGKQIYLRTVELGDSTTLLQWENNTENWSVSQTTQEYSQEDIVNFITEQILQDINKTSDLRLIICLYNHTPIGTIDLTTIDHKDKTAEIGILIAEKKYRQLGYATEAVEGIKHIAKHTLLLRKLRCTIQPNNIASIQLFKKTLFIKIKTVAPIIDYSIYEINLD